MGAKNSELFESIPRAVRSIVTRRNTISGENPKEYEDLLAGLIEHFRPKTVMQWLHVKKLQDIIWHQGRLSRIKPGIMDSMKTEAAALLLKSLPAETQRDLCGENLDVTIDFVAGRWFWDEDVQKAVHEALETFHYSGSMIDAIAFIRRISPLVKLETMEASMDVRQAMVLRQIEEEQDIERLERGTPDDGTEEWQPQALPSPSNNDDEQESAA